MHALAMAPDVPEASVQRDDRIAALETALAQERARVAELVRERDLLRASHEQPRRYRTDVDARDEKPSGGLRELEVCSEIGQELRDRDQEIAFHSFEEPPGAGRRLPRAPRRAAPSRA